MAFYLAQISGTLGGSFPWSMNMLLSSNNTESSVAGSFDTAARLVFTTSSLAPYIPTTVEITQTSVSTASSTFKQTTKTRTVATTAGTSTSPCLPYHTCEILTWRTPYATKWGRGRLYFPPLATNAVATGGGEILAAAQTALQAGWNAFFTSAGASFSVYVLHRKATAGAARLAYSTDQVSGADIPVTFASQRRRADKIVPSRLSVTI
jgi:hypothetical protein